MQGFYHRRVSPTSVGSNRSDALCIERPPSCNTRWLAPIIGRMAPAETIHEISAEPVGGTVWINALDGSCIGRFSKRFGIDVHRTASAQLAGEGQCLLCTHGAADEGAWSVFIEAMREHHGVVVPKDLLSWRKG